VEENLCILSSHGIMAQIIIATYVYIQVYNCSIIGQILHVSNGLIFVEIDILFQKNIYGKTHYTLLWKFMSINFVLP